MRIVSLVPHATELLFALGLGEEIVAVTHECDHPAAALAIERVTRDALPGGLSAGEIDAAVRERTLEGQAIYELDGDALMRLEPDLIVTQALCPVCAVSFDEVAAVAKKIASKPRVIALDPKTLGETLGDIRTLAEATGRRDQGVDLLGDIAGRLDRVKLAVRGAERPRVAAIEWLDPVYIAGHWTPQLIELAGGQDVLGMTAEPSVTVGWEELTATQPEIVVVMPCGYDAARSRLEALEHAGRLESLRARRLVAVNASAYYSRPGPRLIDGVEILATILHPTLFGEALAADRALELEELSLRAPSAGTG
jgi:iron complex transport system substrate-binding protein